MLLQQLCEHAARLDLTPPMYLKTPIRWIVDLDADGRLLGLVRTEGRGGKNDRGKEFSAPHIGRSAGVRAKLLADNGEYVLGIARDPEKQARVLQCHEAFKAEVRQCAAATQEPSVKAVGRFLDSLDPAAFERPADFDPAQTLTFRVDGTLPIELPAVQRHWAQVAGGIGEESAEASASAEMQCLICGEIRPALERLPFKIKRIPGGQTSGMALISANSNAFESYGLEASLIAPTCQDCGERFSKAANALIESPRNHITVGPIVYAFWTKTETAFSAASMLSDPEPEEVKRLIASAFKGNVSAVGLDPAPFYAAAFSASGARVVVRDWIDTTIGRAQRHLARYFALQRLVDLDGSEGRPYGLYALAASTVRDVNRELPANVPRALLDVALKGGALPLWLLFQAVRRNRAEQGVTRNRIALIKMVLLSSGWSSGWPRVETTVEDTMTELDPLNREPAYQCGRLLAVLESVQRAALPGINQTITDRFFGTASSAPASVFGRLLRGAQPHLAKLRKERRGTYEALQQKLEEVQQGLQGFPRVLTLVEQGVFSLGYYHQRASDRAAAKAHKAARAEESSAENQD